MDIIAMALSQATAPPARSNNVPDGEPSAFPETLTSIQSGAPPGPPIPPAATVGKEVAIDGPNAQSRNPDLLLQVTITDQKGDPKAVETDGSVELDSSEALLALVATVGGGAFSTPTLPASAPTVVSPNPQEIVPIGSRPKSREGEEKPAQIGSHGGIFAKIDTPPAADRVDPETGPTIVARPPQEGKILDPGPSKPKGNKVVPEEATIGRKGPITAKIDLPGASDLPPAALNSIRDIAPADPNDRTQPVVIIADSLEPAPPTVVPATDEAAVPTVEQATSRLETAEIAQVKPTAAKTKAVDAASRKSNIDVDPATDANALDKATTVKKVTAKGGIVEVDELKGNTGKPFEMKQDVVEAKPQVGVNDAQPIRKNDLNLVVKQITDRMELLAATRPKNGVTVQLQPARLGSITMTVKSVGSNVEAHISASNDDVRTALEQNRPLLTQSMLERGLKLDAVSIAPQTGNSHRQSSHSQGNSQQQTQHQANSQFGSPSGATHDSARAHQVRQTVRSVDGVDFWI